MQDIITIALPHNNTLTLTRDPHGEILPCHRSRSDFPYTHIPASVWDAMGENQYDYDFDISVSMTYSYIHPDLSTESGDYHDTGYALRDLPENTIPMIDEDFGEFSIPLPGMRYAYSGRSNDLHKLSDDNIRESYDHYDMRQLISCMTIYDEYGRFSTMDDFLKFILSEDHGWYTGEYTEGVTIGLHRPKN